MCTIQRSAVYTCTVGEGISTDQHVTWLMIVLVDLELSKDDLCGWDSHRLAASVLVGRWSSCLKVFATAFMDTVGRQSGSVLSEEQVFEQREKEFRRDMDHLRTSSHKDILLEVSHIMFTSTRLDAVIGKPPNIHYPFFRSLACT